MDALSLKVGKTFICLDLIKLFVFKFLSVGIEKYFFVKSSHSNQLQKDIFTFSCFLKALPYIFFIKE